MEHTDMADGDNSKIDQAISALMADGLIDADDDEIIDGLQPFNLSMDEAVEVWNLIDEIRNEAGTGTSEDEAEEIGKSIDNAYKGGKKGIQESKSNPVTKETELDTDADGDTDITITEQYDGDDSKDSEPTKETKDNSSESEDEPNEDRLNSNVVNAVSEHRF